MPEIYRTLLRDLSEFGLHLLYAIAVVAVGFKLIGPLSRWFGRLKLMKRIDPSVSGFLLNAVTLVLRIAVLASAALILGVPGSAFVALFGSAGVALGLALQGSLSNLAGGLMLLFFRPFSVGDYIMAGDKEGTVKQITAFYTSIVTGDNKRIVLPNGTLTNGTIVNYSAEPTRMVDLAFTMSDGAEPGRVREILLGEAAANPMVLPDPAPAAPMTKLGGGTMGFNLRFWTARENAKPAEYALLESIKAAFDREGIQIPRTQMDVRMQS